ncbi:CynX/NimT family MFS transporter [Actinomyces slackii]|uniref:Inner membrane transport protein YeaN n=1 Tax=Actinomyces slackii TaxID=52774 RepID=A0A3S4WHF5_9ACTO|nr:MFS transporter [Actinomyces slackii]VEG74993.1 Inner membrane transport protein YeaN [Actinomyces slackii]
MSPAGAVGDDRAGDRQPDSPRAAPGPRRVLPRRVWLALIVVGFLAFCAVLRAPVGVIPPLLTRMGQDLGMGEVARGALTSVPLVCFGLMTPLASVVLRRVGINTGGMVTLALVLTGALLRSAGTTWAAFAGTVIIGVGLTMGNLVAPMLIGRDFWHRTSLMTGLYSAVSNVIVTAATALAVPVALVVGWRASAAGWAVIPAAVSALLWWWVFPPGAQSPRQSLRERSGMVSWVRERHLDSGAASRGRAVWRRPLTWVMAVAFAAQTFSYYSILGWLPTALVAMLGMSEAGAGAAASVFSLTGIVGPLLVPIMFGVLKWSDARVLGSICACWLALPVCLVVAPSLWLVPCMLSGIAHGAFFAALFTLVIRRSESIDETRQTTALIQSVGYCVAATGPVVTGWIHGASGGWRIPFAVVVGALVIMTVCGQITARARTARPASHLAVLEGAGSQDEPSGAGASTGADIGDRPQEPSSHEPSRRDPDGGQG